MPCMCSGLIDARASAGCQVARLCARDECCRVWPAVRAAKSASRDAARSAACRSASASFGAKSLSPRRGMNASTTPSLALRSGQTRRRAGKRALGQAREQLGPVGAVIFGCELVVGSAHGNGVLEGLAVHSARAHADASHAERTTAERGRERIQVTKMQRER